MHKIFLKLKDAVPLVVLLTLLFSIPAMLSYRPAGVFHFASAKFAVGLCQSVVYATALALVAELIPPKRFWTTLFVLIGSVICFGELFCFMQLGSRFNSQALFLILQTDSREASEFVTEYLLRPKTLISLVIVGALIGVGWLLRHLWTKMPDKMCRRITTVLLCILPVSVLANILPYQSLKFYDFRSSPLQMVMAMDDIGSHSDEIESLRLTTENITVECVGERPRNIVMIVGESFNKHHSSLYGYDKVTSPALAQEQEKGSLVVFTDIHTRSQATSEVLHQVFSTDIIDKGCPWGNSPLLVSVFDKGGYKVHLFDNHASPDNTSDWDFASSYFHNIGFIGESISIRNDSIFDFDAQMVEYIKRNTAPRSGYNLVIIHLMGQHMPASKRYPSEFEVFHPEDYSPSYTKSQRQEIAHYDNATYYNDHVVSSIIDYFRPYESVIVYFSDHGEEVHDFRDQYGRTLEEPTPEIQRNVYQVPFMVWFSDEYIQRFPDTEARIRGASERNGYNGDVAQMLMDIGNLRIPQCDNGYNLIGDTCAVSPSGVN